MADLARLALPLLRLLPPEAAHDLTLRALASGLVRAPAEAPDPLLRTNLWGRDFPNPIGLAAGFDKNALVPDAMLALGFGFVEIGSVTPRPQEGNPKPRIFRLAEDGAVINRLGFNNEGLAAVAARLSARPLARRRAVAGRGGIVGANIGKNRDAPDAVADYVAGITAFAPLADYLVVNISSPNTPGLRELQRRREVTVLIERLLAARRAAVPHKPPPLLVKIAPDLTEEERADLAEVALTSGIDGLIVSNTTVARPPGLRGGNAHEPGGLSGKPLFAPSTALLAEMHRRTKGRVTLIGVGGVASGTDAYAKIRAGASLVQLYTGLIYQGPALVARIKSELAARLRRDGFASVAAAVGTGS
ncbi:MAG TPA: quinone-dependent dihydroorotate dehydrogenase [Stellaceae bacterium]|jgi:dihydroorotate dehydrogenase|nr:quinone-dependent dihydroorotate dehydrogenase [Stellaceae bacterium]